MKPTRNKNIEIVIGSSLEALLYAFKTNKYIIFANNNIPFDYDYVEPSYDFSFININKGHMRISQEESLSYGPKKKDIWQKLFFLLSISGKILYGDFVRSIRIEEDGELSVGIAMAKRRKIFFSHLYIFDDANIEGLPPATSYLEQDSIIFDWFNVLSGSRHKYDLLFFEDNLVREVHFYESRRVGRGIKDLVAVSYISPDKTKEFCYSETYVKFKLLDIFSSLGIRGSRNGRDVDNPHKYKYYAVNLEPASRLVKHRGKFIYNNTQAITFNQMKFSEIYNLPNLTDGYIKKVANLL